MREIDVLPPDGVDHAAADGPAPSGSSPAPVPPDGAGQPGRRGRANLFQTLLPMRGPIAGPEALTLPLDPVSLEAGSPGPDHPSGSAHPSGTYGRGGRPVTARRDVRWWWIAAGLFALILVGRGVVGAMDSGRTTATPATPSRSPASQPSPAATSSSAGTPTAAPTAAPTTVPAVPPTPTGLPSRVTLPLATASTTWTATAKPSPTTTTAQPSRSQQPVPVTCAVSAAVQPFWGGYNESVRITNTSRTVVQGWTLTFQLPRGQSLTNSWEANFSANGTAVRAGNLGYNATLAPGASVQIGFQARADWPAWPSSFALNGVPCS